MSDIVWLLWFEQEREEGEDTELLIGVYRTDEAAKGAIKRLKDQPGFKDHPEGFQVYSRTLDEDSWTDGFVRALARDKQVTRIRIYRKLDFTGTTVFVLHRLFESATLSRRLSSDPARRSGTLPSTDSGILTVARPRLPRGTVVCLIKIFDG